MRTLQAKYLVIVVLFFLFSCVHAAEQVFPKVNDIRYDRSNCQFVLVCVDINDNEVTCDTTLLNHFQYFWELGQTDFSFEQEPEYKFRSNNGSDKIAKLTMVQIKIYDEEDDDEDEFVFNWTPAAMVCTKTPDVPDANGNFELGCSINGDPSPQRRTRYVINVTNLVEGSTSTQSAIVKITVEPSLGDLNLSYSVHSALSDTRLGSTQGDALLVLISNSILNDSHNIYLDYDIPLSTPISRGTNINMNAEVYRISPTEENDLMSFSDLSAFNESMNSRIPTDQCKLKNMLRDPWDPNSKSGAPQCISDGDELMYTITFSNIGEIAEGAGSTMLVTVQDKLSSDLDLSTFQLREFILMGVAQSIDRIDMSGSAGTDKEFKIDFAADPLPPTPDENETQGIITYSIKTNVGLAANTLIKNQATIIFDNNAANAVETNITENKVNCEQTSPSTGGLSKKPECKQKCKKSKCFKCCKYILIALGIMIFLQLLILFRVFRIRRRR